MLEALPRAPTASQVNMPVSSSGAEAADRTPALADLRDLMQALTAVKEELPPSVKAALQRHMEEDAKVTSIGLHKLVSQQGQARKELLAIRGASYIGSLSGLLEKPLQAKAGNLRKLEESEERWTQQLQSTSRAIAQSSQMWLWMSTTRWTRSWTTMRPGRRRAPEVETSLSCRPGSWLAARADAAPLARMHPAGKRPPSRRRSWRCTRQGPVTSPPGFTGPYVLWSKWNGDGG